MSAPYAIKFLKCMHCVGLNNKPSNNLPNKLLALMNMLNMPTIN